MQLNITELKQQRAKIVTEMRSLQDRIDEDGKETGEDGEKFAKMEKDIRALEIRIEREERLQEEEAKLTKTNGHLRTGNSPDGVIWDGIHYPRMGQTRMPSPAEIERRASYALQGWLLAGQRDAKISEEHLEAARFFGFDLRDKEIPLPIIKNYRQFRKYTLRQQMQYRAGLDTSTQYAGGETIPEGFVNALEVSLLAFGGVRNVADVMRTDSGNDLPWPTVNDTTNKGEILAEASGNIGSSVDPTFGQVIYKAFKYSSKPVLVSFELLQDSAFDLGARLGEMLGIRIGRIQNDHFTTGGGTTLPKGIVISAGSGKVATDDETFTGDELIDLEHSLDPAYRANASWMFHDLTLAKIRKMKVQLGVGVNGDYIWQPGMQAGVPDRLLGYTYTINQSMSYTFSANEKLVLFGDMSKYKIRDVATIRLRRLDELYAATDQVAFVAFLRSDGQLLDAGTDPVKYLALAPS